MEGKDNTGLVVTAIVAAVAITGIVMALLAVANDSKTAGGGLVQLRGKTASSSGQALREAVQTDVSEEFPTQQASCTPATWVTCSEEGNSTRVMSINEMCVTAETSVPCLPKQVCPPGGSECVCPGSPPLSKCENGTLMSPVWNTNWCDVDGWLSYQCRPGTVCPDGASGCVFPQTEQPQLDEFGEPI
ncbi:hypothetical protein HZB03_01980 [Candidatus Woesearchaeota archaeon]|nr:hypothetical protein [Candidatus Woesearchaeota archaeon]